jgi:UPF0755 protein
LKKKSAKKKYFRVGIILAGVLVLIMGSLLFIPATGFQQSEKTIIITSQDATKENFLLKLQKDSILTSVYTFEKIGDLLNIWSKLKPGKYKITRSTGVLNLALMFGRKEQLKNKVIINKIRTKEQFADLISKNLECDAPAFLRFISSNDSLKNWSIDTSTLLSIIIPDTYFFSWNATPAEIIDKLSKESNHFWNNERKEKAAKLGLNQNQAYILASLVEEETTIKEDKPLIAGVYLNRYKKEMTLGSCPSIKFAIKDFSLRRILNEHVERAGNSPYNTYKFKGLPPGPICTPSRETLDAILSATNTEYLYFCAKANSGGRHAFSKTYEEHLENARLYQKWLDEKKIH